jgi:hypothetical protein
LPVAAPWPWVFRLQERLLQEQRLPERRLQERLHLQAERPPEWSTG